MLLDDEVDLASVDLNLNESNFFVNGTNNGGHTGNTHNQTQGDNLVDNRITELQPVQVFLPKAKRRKNKKF